MRKGFPGSNPPPPHWTLPIQDSPSCASPTLKCNCIQYSWSDSQHHLEEFFYQFKLQLELHQQLQDIQCLIKQEVFQTLRDNLGWLNPQNWFDGLNLRRWVFGATGGLLIIIMLCVLHCICKLFSQGRVRDQQVASFVGSIAVLTKNKGGDVGNRSKCGKCGSAPTQKSQWRARLVGRTHVHGYVLQWEIVP